MCMRKQIAMAEENPLKRGTINTADYPMPLLIKILTCHYQIGTTEVHVVFDNPQRLELSLKIVERERRDKKIVCNDDTYTFSEWSSNSKSLTSC